MQVLEGTGYMITDLEGTDETGKPVFAESSRKEGVLKYVRQGKRFFPMLYCADGECAPCILFFRIGTNTPYPIHEYARQLEAMEKHWQQSTQREK